MRLFQRLPGLAASAWLLTPIAAIAAPYCVHTLSVPPQCIYDDPNECRVRANQLNGYCIANPQDTKVQAGIGQYCLLVAGGAPSCVFTDQGLCQQEATRQRGACITAPQATGRNLAPNPYRNLETLPAG